MKITFIGVGEACDGTYVNSSILVDTPDQHQILLDCGFSVPHHYFPYLESGDQLDGIWISHFHGDHFLGLPQLILRLWQMGRCQPLNIIGQTNIQEKVEAAMALAYPGFLAKLDFPLIFHQLEPGNNLTVAGVNWTCALTQHSQRNLGVHLEDHHQCRLYYSGDGLPGTDTPRLIKNCDLIIHEAYRLDEEVYLHNSVTGCLRLAQEANAKRLAIIHLERESRKNLLKEIQATLSPHSFAVLPEEGDCITL